MGHLPPLAQLGLLAVVGVAVALAVRVVRAVRRRRMPEPQGQPLERLAGSLRRVRTELRRAAPGMSAVRRRGLCMAYDELLGEACRALGIEHELQWLTGFEQEMERLRVEDALARAGIQLGDDSGREPDGGCADESNAA